MNAHDKFAPLAPVEIAVVPSVIAESHDDGELVSPVPTNAPHPPQTHKKWGKPTARWLYTNATGATLQIIFRFDPSGGRKQILPCTLWRGAAGLRWRWKGLPAPRPLYGLDRLATRPDAPVIVCEGEKATDAAAVIFPDYVAVTSPGGAFAAAKADWKPVARRRVLIWSDADDAGANYAQVVATILAPLECEVSVINANALAAIDPIGNGKREPVVGWDAADAIVE
jgi:putative DNA primase/helicase